VFSAWNLVFGTQRLTSAGLRHRACRSAHRACRSAHRPCRSAPRPSRTAPRPSRLAVIPGRTLLRACRGWPLDWTRVLHDASSADACSAVLGGARS